ncbi:hypothetical protein AAFM48_24805 [Burkholderia pseudomallei]
MPFGAPRAPLPCAMRRAPRAAARSTAVAGACVDRHRERTASARRALYPPVLRIRAAHPLADRVRQPILGSLEGIRAHRIGREHHVGRAVVLHDPREIVERNRDRTGGRPIRSTA